MKGDIKEGSAIKRYNASVESYINSRKQNMKRNYGANVFSAGESTDSALENSATASDDDSPYNSFIRLNHNSKLHNGQNVVKWDSSAAKPNHRYVLLFYCCSCCCCSIIIVI